jgi:POT family proton-dependent oligopeptide transporter
MWERFSLWNESLVDFYLTKIPFVFEHFGNLLIGSYAALVYAVCNRRFIADRYLGFRKAIVLGI